MKRNFLKISLVAILLAAMFVDANAQRRGNRRGAPPPTNDQQQQNNNNNPPTNFPQNGNIPYRFDSSAEGGLDTTRIRSLRQEGAFPCLLYTSPSPRDS